MSQPAASQSSAGSQSRFRQVRYNAECQNLRTLRVSLTEVKTKEDARQWAEECNRLLTNLRATAEPGVDVLQKDLVVSGIVASARDHLIDFATSDWIQIAPDLVDGVEATLSTLAHGQSIGEQVLSERGGSPTVAPPPAPSPSPSLLAPVNRSLPTSRSHSSGSGGLGAPREASTESVPRLSISLPRPSAVYRTRQATSPAVPPPTGAPPAPPARSSATVAPRTTSRKRARISSISTGVSKRTGKMQRKTACQRCALQKRACVWKNSASPPTCEACLAKGEPCVPRTDRASSPRLRTRRRQASPSGLPASPPGVPATPPRRKSGPESRARSPSDYMLPDEGAYPEPPPLPLAGPPDGESLSVALTWHNEVLAAQEKHEACLSAVANSKRRLRLAWRNYIDCLGYRFLSEGVDVDPEEFVRYGGTVTMARKPKGKGKARAEPVPTDDEEEVNSSSDDDFPGPEDGKDGSGGGPMEVVE